MKLSWWDIWKSSDHSFKAGKINLSTSAHVSSALTSTNSVLISTGISNHSIETGGLISDKGRLEQFEKTKYLWWTENLKMSNKREIGFQESHLVMQNNPSNKDWESYCSRISTEKMWSKEEKNFHINILQIITVKIAILTFMKGRSLWSRRKETNKTFPMR